MNQTPKKFSFPTHLLYGPLLILAVVACVLGPIAAKHLVPAIADALGAWLVGLCFVPLLLVLGADIVLLEKRSKQPGFDAWDEI